MRITRRHNKGHGLSIRSFMTMSMWSLLILIAAIFWGVMIALQILPSLDDVAYRSLYNHAAGNVSRLASELTVVSRAAQQTANLIEGGCNDFLKQNELKLDDLQGNTAQLDLLLEKSLEPIQGLLDNITATGAFVIYNTSYTGGANLASLYLRDPTPGIKSSTPDFTLLRGPSRIAGEHRPPLESGWSYEQPLDSLQDSRYYVEPQNAARQYPKADPRDWGYWSEPFRLSSDDLRIITYTLPLLDGDRNPIGVIGVEYTVNYFTQIMPPENLPFPGGFYLISTLNGDTLNTASALSQDTNGAIFLLDYPEEVELQLLHDTADYTVYTSGRDPEMYFSRFSLGLYGQNSPFTGEQYYLYAVAPRDEVLQSSRNIKSGLLVAMAATMLVAFFVAMLISRNLAGRIEKLAAEVRGGSPERPMSLSPTSIYEIDALSDVIGQMSRDLIQYAARMSTIVDLVGIPMGAFEIQHAHDRVFLTKSLYRLLGIPHNDGDSSYMAYAQFAELFPMITLSPEKTHAEMEIEWTRNPQEEKQWLQIRLMGHSGNVYGTIVDISDEVRQKQRLQFERDYDPLTRLLNRNSYPDHMNALIRQAPRQLGVLLFGDLDNLKHINDTFGHDMGDRYIQMAAGALRLFERIGGVVARISGDEFAVYIHGGESREALRAEVDAVLEQVRAKNMTLPDGKVQNVRISVGLSYYPDDATQIETLIKYADFAMYEIKHTVKGQTREFDRVSYDRNGAIVKRPSQLDRLIDDKRIAFAFQPVLDAKTGEIFGYEALMRPQMREIHTPTEVLELAGSQSKLYEIELLTLTCALSWYAEHIEELGGKKLFINLLASQTLSDADCTDIRKLLPADCGNLVMELTGIESGMAERIAGKAASLRGQGCMLALDDYRAGPAGDALLPVVKPDFVKTDRSIVRGIDADPAHQAILRRLIEQASADGVRVVAKGVENAAELECVIGLGARFIQGFYTCMPEYELDRHNKAVCAKARALYLRQGGG